MNSYVTCLVYITVSLCLVNMFRLAGLRPLMSKFNSVIDFHVLLLLVSYHGVSRRRILVTVESCERIVHDRVILRSNRQSFGIIFMATGHLCWPTSHSVLLLETPGNYAGQLFCCGMRMFRSFFLFSPPSLWGRLADCHQTLPQCLTVIQIYKLDQKFGALPV